MKSYYKFQFTYCITEICGFSSNCVCLKLNITENNKMHIYSVFPKSRGKDLSWKPEWKHAGGAIEGGADVCHAVNHRMWKQTQMPEIVSGLDARRGIFDSNEWTSHLTLAFSPPCWSWDDGLTQACGSWPVKTEACCVLYSQQKVVWQ